MNELRIFNNADFGDVRTVEKDGNIWFVGKDVAEALGYERPTKAVQDHIDEEDKDVVPIQDSIGRKQNTPIINESGLYSLVLSSKLPSAKVFKRWITFLLYAKLVVITSRQNSQQHNRSRGRKLCC